MKKIFTVNDDYVNARLDRWFKKNVCDVPQGLIEKSIRKGYIKVNNNKKKVLISLKVKIKLLFIILILLLTSTKK